MMDNPFKCEVRCTNPYKPKTHYGEDYVPIDKKKTSNWNLYAPADGRVIISKKQKGDYAGGYGAYGNYLVLDCNGIWVLFAHLQSLPLVKVNEKVSKGQKIGIAGNTGNSTGRHLHIEVSDHPDTSSYDWYFAFRKATVKPSDYIDFSNHEEGFNVKEWKNGKTREVVYSTVEDCKLQENRIGSIDPYEKADCYGIVDGCYLVVYHTSSSLKTGFVRYSGGVK